MVENQQQAELNQIHALNYLGQVYLFGLRGNSINLTKSAEYFKRAADRDPPSADYLGHMYLNGYGVDKKNATKARKLFTFAAQRNYGPAQNNLAYLEKSEGNWKMALAWYKKAARNNNYQALYELGQMHRLGIHVKKDLKLAKMYYRQAVDHGHDKSIYQLAQLW
eukprot:CAMPEP_0114657064 /NCGR_PEP_ID=MMETSP0191-20121206/13291_1 /TAXON_ID=126664 /ORGANISM="Sorites sp." /LENGTH=164 /DNA_ID=CAMNT_0001875547 /DNA_START=396 /DNA_END=887 /DNA_ORIENTATION=-